MNENTKEMIKPFEVELEKEEKETVNQTEDVKREAPTPTTTFKNGVEMMQPFTTIDTPTKKLYLLLKVYNDFDAGEGDAEQPRDWEFFTGTSQELYDKVKEEIIESDDSSVRQKIDVMQSIILVNSTKVTIEIAVNKNRPCSYYTIMKNLKEQGKVVDDTSFDIEDYKYDMDNEEAI